jgi:cysteine desulfurase
MIYLDNNATTPLHPKVKAKIIEVLDQYVNPSSAYELGRNTHYLVEEARKNAADFLHCFPEELIFTASGSETNNTILKSALERCCRMGCSDDNKELHIISSRIEHPSVLNTLKCLENQNVKVTYLPVDEYGIIDPDDVKKAINKNTILISIMYANNEIGTIQPIEEISKIAREHHIEFHTDAVQAIGKVDIDLSKSNIDYMSISGHKIYAPKGVGILYKRKGIKQLCPLITGGHQERSMRAGTENTIGIIALGEAFKQMKLEMNEEVKRIKILRDKLENGIFEKIPEVRLNGHKTKRLPGTLNVSFKNIEGESILLRLDMHGIAISTGSACSTGSLEPSHVIMALGTPQEVAHGSIRFSLGRENTEEEIDFTVERVKEVVEFLRKISPLR